MWFLYLFCPHKLPFMSSSLRTLLLWGGGTERLWTWCGGVSLQGMPLCWGQNLWHQCWSYAIPGKCQKYQRINGNNSFIFLLVSVHFCLALDLYNTLSLSSLWTVGVPGGSLWRHWDGGPSVGCALLAASRLWRLRDRCHTRSQTNEGQLERRWLPHERQHQTDEGRGGSEVSSHFFKWKQPTCNLGLNYSRQSHFDHHLTKSFVLCVEPLLIFQPIAFQMTPPSCYFLVHFCKNINVFDCEFD